MEDIDEIDIIEGKFMTKEKRHELFGEVGHGAGSRTPEIYQRKMIEQYSGHPCTKTNTRINLMTYTLAEISRPNTKEDGFNYSEDFDGCQNIQGKKIFVNMKCISGTGGNQTRSLREVYWFVRGQLEVIKNTPDANIYFANILDGDEAHACMTKFHFLLQQYTSSKRVYVGDLRTYFKWLKRIL
jgi:hypothetical protein